MSAIQIGRCISICCWLHFWWFSFRLRCVFNISTDGSDAISRQLVPSVASVASGLQGDYVLHHTGFKKVQFYSKRMVSKKFLRTWWSKSSTWTCCCRRRLSSLSNRQLTPKLLLTTCEINPICSAGFKSIPNQKHQAFYEPEGRKKWKVRPCVWNSPLCLQFGIVFKTQPCVCNSALCLKLSPVSAIRHCV